MVRLLAERYDTRSKLKLGGFRSQLQASYVSSHTEKLWYNETVCLWISIYIYILCKAKSTDGRNDSSLVFPFLNIYVI